MADQLSQTEDLLNRLREGAAAIHRPEDVSKRTPNTCTDFNEADDIERQLLADGHIVWGFVIYRCTYYNDEGWTTFIRNLSESVRKSMEFYNGRDILASLRLTVFDDQEKFNGMSKSNVREHFREWCETAIGEEQGSREEIGARHQGLDPKYDSQALRYRFCIQVDEAALQSIISDGKPSWSTSEGWVNLIKADWQPRSQEVRTQDPVSYDDEDEFGDEDEVYDAIEGCTQEDVGWMKVQYMSLMPTFYTYLRDPNAWHSEYRRPPAVASAALV